VIVCVYACFILLGGQPFCAPIFFLLNGLSAGSGRRITTSSETTAAKMT
jgi:hypothetical protein